MDYRDILPIIEDLGVSVTLNTNSITSIDDYGNKTLSTEQKTISVCIQNFTSESNLPISNISSIPNYIMYTTEQITDTDTISYSGSTYKIQNVIMQPSGTSYVYYKAYLVKQ